MSEQTPKGDPLDNLSSTFIALAEASKFSGLSASHLRKLVREGQIKGVKIGRNWLTTKEAVQEYLKQERRPGPK